jgi:hypothetical protein
MFFFVMKGLGTTNFQKSLTPALLSAERCTAPPQAAPVLVLRGACPERPCLRHSPASPPVERLFMRVSSYALF